MIGARSIRTPSLSSDVKIPLTRPEATLSPSDGESAERGVPNNVFIFGRESSFMETPLRVR
jgi:hypothetical protein